MRVARIGNLYQPVPAVEYGGTQRSMAQMTAMQAAICGHDVTLYAASDSNIIEFSQKISSDLGINSKINKLGTSIAIENMNGTTGYVHLKSCNTNSIGYTDPNEDKKHHQLFSQLKADNALNPYDIIHNHHRWFMQHAIIPSNLTYKTLTHQHTGKLENNYTELGSYPLICISKSQADILKASYNANVFDVVYHGLDAGAYKPTLKDAGYLAWIGRFLPEKGADTAITIAKELKTPLVIAGVIYDKKQVSINHFENDIRPHITTYDENFLKRISGMPSEKIKEEIQNIANQSDTDVPIIFCGSADEEDKQALYGNAKATLFPITWAEPFGRVMIESMACGTPVIGNKNVGDIYCGSVAEIIDNGLTGYTIDAKDKESAIIQSLQAINSLDLLDRKIVRNVFEQKWTSETAAQELDTTYKKFLLKNKK